VDMWQAGAHSFFARYHVLQQLVLVQKLQYRAVQATHMQGCLLVFLLECLFYIHGVRSLARLHLLTKAASGCPYSSSKSMLYNVMPSWYGRYILELPALSHCRVLLV
jgi:hypothetical protein